MAKIYRRTDRIKIKIDDVTVTVSPLSSHEKAEIQSEMIKFVKGDVKAGQHGICLSLKYAVKDIEGIEDSNGSNYSLKFENGYLSDECVDDLLNMEITGKLSQVCASLSNGVPTEFRDREGNNLAGVEFVKAASPAPNVQT
jgi:hypothetical protein